MRAGMPTAVAPAGTGLMTTALLPILAPSPTVKAAQHLGAGAHHHILAQRGVALGTLVQRGAAQRHALVDGAAVANFGRFAHHHAHGVVEEHAFADLGAGVDFNAGEPARKVRDEAPQPFEPVRPAPVRRPVQPHGVQAGVTGDDLPGAAAAGSRSRMHWMSERRRANMVVVVFGIWQRSLALWLCRHSIMALATPRRMWISSGLSCARLNSWFRRGMSFLGAAGSRKPMAVSACSQCASMPATWPGHRPAHGRARAWRTAKPPSAWRHS
jgi:hypothetical protein